MSQAFVPSMEGGANTREGLLIVERGNFIVLAWKSIQTLLNVPAEKRFALKRFYMTTRRPKFHEYIIVSSEFRNT